MSTGTEILNPDIHLPSLVEQLVLLKRCGGLQKIKVILEIAAAIEQNGGHIQRRAIRAIKVAGDVSLKEVREAFTIATTIAEAGTKLAATVSLDKRGIVKFGNLHPIS